VKAFKRDEIWVFGTLRDTIYPISQDNSESRIKGPPLDGMGSS
jgi:hypothetical protein